MSVQDIRPKKNGSYKARNGRVVTLQKAEEVGVNKYLLKDINLLGSPYYYDTDIQGNLVIGKERPHPWDLVAEVSK